MEEGEDLRLNRHVERGRRLVRDQHFGVVGDCHGDHHPLALAAREFVRIRAHARLRVGNSHEVQKLDGAGLGRVGGEAPMLPDRLDELIADAVERVERGHRLLEDHGDLGAADAIEAGGRKPEDFLALEFDRALDLAILG